MRYIIHDGGAYGIHNGIAECDIQDYVCREAKTLGLTVLDYSIEEIMRTLRRDKELEQLAQNTYTPFPLQDNWSEDYKAFYRQAIANRTAPGKADIPEKIVYEKIHAILQQLAHDTLPERLAKADAEAEERKFIMGKIERIDTGEKKITDDGGSTIMYTHRVTLKSGTTLEFTDRNLFDFGRVINPTYSIAEGIQSGGIYSRLEDGSLVWLDDKEGHGLVPVRPLTEDETFAVNAVTKYYGHSDTGIRM